MSSVEVDPGRLDDAEALAAADPGEMLRRVASAAAQVREAQLYTAEAGVERIAQGGRPRAIVVVGTSGSGLAGEMLAAVCGQGCRVPITTVRGHRLPGWVGAADLVIAVSGPGGTEETLAAAVEAVRRGCRLLCVGAAGSPLAEIAVQAGVPFVPVRAAGPERAMLWGLTVPLLLAARALDLVDITAEALERTAGTLEDMSHQCRPASESFVNPAKQVALELAGSVPVIWGTSPMTGAAAHRFASQLAANAGCPALHGELPAAWHDQAAMFDGPFAAGSGGSGGSAEEDFFRDRVEEPEPTRLSLVLLNDVEEHPQVTRRRELAAEFARDRAVPVVELTTRGTHPLERLAGLIAHIDYISVYLALAVGVDPSATVREPEERTL
ncbi:SIS domain-containing protein [Actinoallomurus soli]|uniref:SIS domain-containing protein n=1 Tax=Actinoallomurus soli TaxID=2952535 RepID=UPI002092B67D|nr:SIS domain-containing protein [Actinoallomurus soli]MCO5969189.1 mannose-6-phosphate isomerase [Actinoallomurus soli]